MVISIDTQTIDSFIYYWRIWRAYNIPQNRTLSDVLLLHTHTYPSDNTNPITIICGSFSLRLWCSVPTTVICAVLGSLFGLSFGAFFTLYFIVWSSSSSRKEIGCLLIQNKLNVALFQNDGKVKECLFCTRRLPQLAPKWKMSHWNVPYAVITLLVQENY